MSIRVYRDYPKFNQVISVSSKLLLSEPKAAEIVQEMAERETLHLAQITHPNNRVKNVYVTLSMDIDEMCQQLTPSSIKHTTLTVLYTSSYRLAEYLFDSQRDLYAFKLANPGALDGCVIEHRLKLRFEGIAYVIPSIDFANTKKIISYIPDEETQRIINFFDGLFWCCDDVEITFVRSAHLSMRYHVYDAVVLIRTTQFNKLKLVIPTISHKLSDINLSYEEALFDQLETTAIIDPSYVAPV